MTTPEGKVKDLFKELCEAHGWTVVCLIDASRRGWPDRTVLGQGARVAFCELKAIGVKHNKAHLARQEKRLKKLRDLGFYAEMVTGEEAVRVYVDTLAMRWSG